MLLLIIIISIVLWFCCGLYGYSLLVGQNYDLFKIDFYGQKKSTYSAKILLGPIFLV